MSQEINRRSFIKKASAFGVGAFVAPQISSGNMFYSGKSRINLGFIGVGLRGRAHLGLISKREDVRVTAICDINSDAIQEAQKVLRENNRAEAEVYQKDEQSYRELLKRKDIDGVLIATPWRWHSPMAVDAMRQKKYVGLEVPAATTLEGCWNLVKAHEETGTHLMFLENVCYAREVLAVLKMVRENVFGTLVHATCGYKHDLRGVKFNDGKSAYGEGVKFGEDAVSEAKWRTEHSLKRNADLYPTHGVGPVAKWLNINRGNRFLFLTSTATKSEGLHNYIVNHPKGGADHPNAKLDWKLGDIVTTVIKTTNGETIIISHDTNLPRPYSWGFTLHGTNGVWNGQFEGKRLYVEGKSESHQWSNDEMYKKYMEKYDHPLWKKYAEEAQEAGHGGIDYFTDKLFVESVKENAHPPIDVYDAAAWSSITPLSEKSIAMGSKPVYFPDFTGGQYIQNEPIFGKTK